MQEGRRASFCYSIRSRPLRWRRQQGKLVKKTLQVALSLPFFEPEEIRARLQQKWKSLLRADKRSGRTLFFH